MKRFAFHLRPEGEFSLARYACRWVVTKDGVILGYFSPRARAEQFAEVVGGVVEER